MTKICPDCGNKNKETSKFCEDCGTTLNGNQIKSKSNLESLKSIWNRQSTGVKAIGVCCLGLIILVVIGGIISPDVNTSNTTYQSSDADSTDKNTQSTKTAQSANTQAGNEYTIGNSKFYLLDDWEEGFRSEGAEGLERIRLDKSDKTIIMTQYFDKIKYESESENAINTKTISDVQVKRISGYPAIVWFEKNGKYYHITVNNLDSSGNWEDGTDDDIKYIEEIIGSIQ